MEKNDIGWNLENSYTKLPELFYTPLKLETVSAPKLVVLNRLLAKEIGLDSEALMGQAGIDILAGQALPINAKPIAQAYAGHQFGHFTMLGDGRAMLIGEQITPTGERFDIQLKGSGRTPYSRSGDGRAALGPVPLWIIMIRIRSLVPLIYRDGMPIGINLILAYGIWPNLLKP